MKEARIFLAAGCLIVSMAAQAADQHVHWDYKGPASPSHWGDLEPDFAACKLGKEQSPIDIRGAQKAKLDPIDFSYSASPGDIVNNGHTIQVNLASAGAIGLSGGRYKLVQFHLHTPSEEKINGVAFPMVAHLVHKNDEGKLAVVAVLFKQGKENAVLKAVFDNMPVKAGETRALAGELNAADLLPAERVYYAFAGSLTTPPCSEGVRWQVLNQPMEISAAQLKAFKTLYPMNARPVQPLNGRKIQVGG